MAAGRLPAQEARVPPALDAYVASALTPFEAPNERILVIFGAGHLGWRRQDVVNDATVRLRTFSEFIGR